ncbi:MAG: HAD family hydrolase [Thermomicrobiales bacterium]
MPYPVLFIDDGDVMNDNDLRGSQWQRLVGAFFAPILGGAPERWAGANRTVPPRLWEAFHVSTSDRVDADYDAFNRAFQLAWLRDMCAEVGVAAPIEEEAILRLVHRADAYVTPRVRATYPGVADAIRTLHARGYHLHTASGEHSGELDGYLIGMGVRHCFGRLYGADLVMAHKSGPTFYARVFADAGVDPADALVVDDKPKVLAWAAALGARTAVVGQATGDFEPDLRVASLAALPDAIGVLALVR